MENTRQQTRSRAEVRKRAKTRRRFRSDYYDYNLVVAIILLVSFGLVMLYSTSSYMAQVKYGDDMFFFRKQAMISAVCLVFAIAISVFDYHILKNFRTLLYFGAIGLMVLVKTPLGTAANGARRWLKIGPIQFQPAEIAKIAVIVFVAYSIIDMGKQVKTLRGSFTLLGYGTLQAAVAYIFTDNLSTAIIILGITGGLLFVAHPYVKPFLIAAAVVIPMMIIGVLLISNMPMSGDSFRLQRIQVWLHPEEHSAYGGYQTLQALYAIGSGGFFGRGLGNSIQKLGSVPEAQNDMIFSIICEEWGVFGALIVLVLFGFLLYRLFFIAQNAPDMFGSLIVSGIFIHIALQVIFNIAVVLNLMPNTGVTLPFISYGGTSVLFLMTEMGIALSVARRIKFKEPETSLYEA